MIAIKPVNGGAPSMQILLSAIIVVSLKLPTIHHLVIGG